MLVPCFLLARDVFSSVSNRFPFPFELQTFLPFPDLLRAGRRATSRALFTVSLLPLFVSYLFLCR